MYGPLLVDNGRVRGIIAISTTLDIGSHYFSRPSQLRVRHVRRDDAGHRQHYSSD